LHLIILSKN